MNGPFVCPHCGSQYLVMGYYVEGNAPCFLRCRNCGFTENFPRFLEEIPSTIEKRPVEINARSTWGHWEMDTVIGHAKGKGQAALVLTERLTRYELIFKLKDKTSKSVVSTLSKLSKCCDFPNIFKSITVDNGSEFQDCKGMERLKTKVYYCHPYTSSERGSNERMNRMIRRFFPKGSDFNQLKQKDFDRVKDYLNNYQRRVLGGQTPLELWLKCTTVPPL